MSMSVYVHGIRNITEDYRKKLNIYKSCKELNIKPPEELLEYFEYESYPCEDGIIVDLPDDSMTHSTNMQHCSDYYDVNLTKLPKDVIKVRFEISY